MLYLRDDFKQAWLGKDPHQLLDTMDGEVYRAVESRRTFRFKLNDSYYFAKVHRGIGWKAIIEELVRFRKPVLGALDEWLALNRLKELGLKTMTPVAFGQRGCNPAKQHSFIVTEALSDMWTLEDFCEKWRAVPPDFIVKQEITKNLADISRILHDNGINHRDYYLCHFMLKKTTDLKPESLEFYLIDLHRAQIRSSLPDRWRLKDLSGLYFSAMDYGFTQRDIFRFIKLYTNLSLRDALTSPYWQKMWKKIDKKSAKLYKRMERKAGHPNY